MIQGRILKNTFKKNYIYVFIFFFYLILDIIVLKLKQFSIYNIINEVMGIPGYDIGILSGFKIVLFIYLIYYFYTYEFSNNYDCIFLRIDLRKFYLFKIWYLVCFVVLLNVIHFIIGYVFFGNLISFDILFLMIKYFMCLMVVVLFWINLFNNKLVIFCLSCIVGYIIFVNFSFRWYYWLVGVIINYVLFRINIKRKYFNK